MSKTFSPGDDRATWVKTIVDHLKGTGVDRIMTSGTNHWETEPDGAVSDDLELLGHTATISFCHTDNAGLEDAVERPSSNT